MSRAVFEELNAAREINGEPLLANPRNAAAGSAFVKIGAKNFYSAKAAVLWAFLTFVKKRVSIYASVSDKYQARERVP